MSAEPPACADCLWLVGVRDRLEYYQGWVCHNPQNILSKDYNLVTGRTDTKLKDATCVDCRRNAEACGPAGKGFELYVKPDYSPSAPGKVSAGADALLSELENLK